MKGFTWILITAAALFAAAQPADAHRRPKSADVTVHVHKHNPRPARVVVTRPAIRVGPVKVVLPAPRPRIVVHTHTSCCPADCRLAPPSYVYDATHWGCRYVGDGLYDDGYYGLHYHIRR